MGSLLPKGLDVDVGGRSYGAAPVKLTEEDLKRCGVYNLS